ncbi:MAG: hypothetical protein AVDCRST_MAG05-48, partial [uncultured Rubrobacteraceae bacterium]
DRRRRGHAPNPHRGATPERGRRELEDGRGGPAGPQRHAPRARPAPHRGDRQQADAGGLPPAPAVAQGAWEV